jgi:ABC-type Fe3+/spermidine/putrescine transport system ATPase subunit
MTGIEVEGLTAGVGGFRLGPLDLSVAPGEALVVLGPSGAGKTTLLRALAGFVPAAARSLRIGGQDRRSQPPESRGIGYVPQGLGLFPHRTVKENVAYPLESRGRPEAARRVENLLEDWGLASLARRRPDTLSGGERQRVAMARALAAEPRALLWDEPLGALDPLARGELIEVLHRALRASALPLLLVTHDAETAFTVGDRCLVLGGGRVRFRGEGAALAEAPPDRFSARFVGYENVYACAELARCRGEPFADLLAMRAGAEGVCLPARGGLAPAGGSRFRARLERRRRLPSGDRVWLRVGGLGLCLDVPARSELKDAPVGAEVGFDLEETALRPLGEVP